jgi:hypothetical protein
MLVLFLAVSAVSWRKVYKLRNNSPAYNAWLLPFAFFSLSSWILWASQYVMLLVNSFNHSQSDLFQNTGLCLGVMQNALWASSLWSLQSKQVPKVSLTLFILIMFSIVIALASYQSSVLTPQSLAYLAAVSSAMVFLVIALSIRRLGLNMVLAAVFFIHGFFQWTWNLLWFKPLDQTQGWFLAFPVWYTVLLGIWLVLISEMRVPLRVMISSTVSDLTPEREAAEKAIRELQLDGIRAETFGSLSGTPMENCALWAEQCDIFLLIIGKNYGSIIESKGISVVRFEYQTAHAQNPKKILAYVKDGVDGDQSLKEFRKEVEDFEHGHFRGSFTTPEDLEKQIQDDIKRWLALQENPKPRKRARRSRAGNNWILTSL